MFRNPDGTDTSADCIIQDHMHLLSTNRLQVRILAQRQQGYEILSAAMGSSLNNDAATVKKEIIKRVILSKIPLDGKQFDISWEEKEIDGYSTPMFMALATAPYAVDVEHVFPVLSEPTNDSTQFPATHPQLQMDQPDSI